MTEINETTNPASDSLPTWVKLAIFGGFIIGYTAGICSPELLEIIAYKSGLFFWQRIGFIVASPIIIIGTLIIALAYHQRNLQSTQTIN